MASTSKGELSEAQKLRIERNRQKALQLRAAKFSSHPYAKSETDDKGKTIIKAQGSKYVDSGGGFLIEQSIKTDGSSETVAAEEATIPVDDAIQIPVVYEECVECGQKFAESFLMKTFIYCVCDTCRDSDDKHSLITRTEAKAEYLLKDCDFDKREPPLKYILRKNPHNPRWGDMRLYLHLQVEKRALEVWGSEEKLIAERDARDEKREKSKHKNFNKNLKKLRMEMRSSLFDKTTAKQAHQHDFINEVYNEDDDTYTHFCKHCGFHETYEKM